MGGKGESSNMGAKREQQGGAGPGFGLLRDAGNRKAGAMRCGYPSLGLEACDSGRLERGRDCELTTHVCKSTAPGWRGRAVGHPSQTCLRLPPG